MTEYEIACLGKSRFLSRREAKHRANAIRREGGPAFRTYDCRFCGLWHRPGHATYLRQSRHGPIRAQEHRA